jgi:hypothetical protein
VIGDAWLTRWQQFAFYSSIVHTVLPPIEAVRDSKWGQRWPWLEGWYGLFIFGVEKFAALNNRGLMLQWYKKRMERNGSK